MVKRTKSGIQTCGPTGRTEPPTELLKVASRPNSLHSASDVTTLPMSSRTVTSGPSSMILQPQYQTVTIDTEKGTAQLAVDVQTASKAADEKRKRNATALHRFRQHRKEKERETSETISRLEVKASERAEERDYYIRERNYYRDLVYQNRICSTPPSPWRRRYTMVAPVAQHQEVRGTGMQSGGHNGKCEPTSSTIKLPPTPTFERVGADSFDYSRLEAASN